MLRTSTRSLWHTIIFIIAAIMIWPVALCAKEKQLAIINSYNEAGPWSKDIILPIAAKIANVPGVTAEIINLNGILMKDTVRLHQMIDGVFDRFPADNTPEYVVLIGNHTTVMLDRIKKEWGDVPIMLITKSLKYGDETHYLTSRENFGQDSNLRDITELVDDYNLTIIYVPDYYEETIDLMVRTNPDMKMLVFLADEYFFNRTLNSDIKKYMAEKYPDIEYYWLQGNRENSNKLREYLAAEDPETGLLISTWFYEHINVHGYPVLVGGDFYLIPSTKAPVFSLRDSYINYGAIGGVYPDPEGIRDHIDTYLNQILMGKQARDLPVYLPDKHVTMISYPQLQESKIDPATLPDDTVMIDAPPSFFELYRWQILATVFGVLLILIGLMIWAWLQRKKVGWLRSFHQLVSNMPIPYTRASVQYNHEGYVRDIHYQTFNTAFQEMVVNNYDKANNYKLFPPQYIASFVQALINTRQQVSFTHYFSQSDTYYQFIMCIVEGQNEARPADIDIFAIDITARSKTELSLKETARKLDLTLNAARIIPWQWNLQNHTINCEAHRVFKSLNIHSRFVPGEMTYLIDESDYFRSVHPDDLPKLMEIKQAFIDGRTTHEKVEFRMVYSRKGHQFIEWFEVSVAVGRTLDDGTIASLMGSLLIITERKRQENLLVAATDKAKESDRLKSAFLANMSHEIRTPLNAIVGFSNLLAQTKEEDKKAQYANIINDNNSLLLQLINDVLDLAKIESNTLDFQFAPTDINAVINSVAETISLKVPRNVMFNVVPTQKVCVVNTDGNRLQQVLINLLTNACKFTTRGSITLSYELIDDTVYFEVRDTGIGLSEDDSKKLFQRFTKLNDFAQGNGLGLSISKSIVDRLGGKIGVKSRGPGRGSTFWFTIPYEPAELPDAPGKEEHEKIPVPAERFTILVADDNDSNFLLLESILEEHYTVIRAANGQQAVEMVRHQRPNLILMDLNMPVMDGYKATEEIRKFNKTVPIIAVTAYALASDRKKVLSTNNFDSYVPKPIDSSSLLSQISSLINKNFFII